MNRMPALIVLLFIACLLAFSCTPVRSEGVDMVEMVGQPAELRFTLEISRAATGKTETVEMVGYANLTPEQLKQLKESTDGSDPLDRSA